MIPRGKSINIFLMDGEPSGRIKCTLANWTGVAYKVPRTSLDLCKERNDLKQSGIYLLFGTSDQTGNSVVYVGQAGARKNGEGLLYRLLEHKRNVDKNYWTEAVVLTTSNNSFGPTEISYLENRFCGLAFAAKRYEVQNGNAPTQGNITEEKESELEEFIDYARILIGTLGYKVFEPIVAIDPTAQTDSLSAEDEPILYFNRANLQTTGRRTSEGFVVFKESAVAPDLQRSCPENIVKLRDKYKNKLDSNNKLLENILFTSPSAAASFVGGASLSGNEMWRTAGGVTLKNFENKNNR